MQSDGNYFVANFVRIVRIYSGMNKELTNRLEAAVAALATTITEIIDLKIREMMQNADRPDAGHYATSSLTRFFHQMMTPVTQSAVVIIPERKIMIFIGSPRKVPMCNATSHLVMMVPRWDFDSNQ